MADDDQTPDRPVPDRPERPLPERPLPERPLPDRGAPGTEGPSGTSSDHGMTKVALVLLVFVLLVCGWRLYEFWDGRQPPSGVQTQEATVLGFEQLGSNRPGSTAPRNASIHFRLPDGTEASALYQLRSLGEAEKGDTITVYQREGVWRTTSEKSVGGIVWWVAGTVLVLVMIVGWFRVRARARRGLGALRA